MGDSDATPQIRTARPDDLDAVGELTLEVYVGEGYIRRSSPYVSELGDGARRAAHAQILVAEHGGAIVGSLTVARPGTVYADVARPGEIEFRMLAVSKAVRGLGVGTALVRKVIEIGAAEGFAAVVLTTMPAMVDARRIYDRLGFVATPERDWRTDAGDALTVMRLDLPAA
ncbi:GNAT family N-acetyltransferase [Nocardia bovistercoris]|uniref:GNAT family N-acetyltransferase n=1 Tax=Nocardia bovistercoris TaxID=2785916 RepID=A0A931N6W0_9NOCA|nr:GNAT family N-acetyltransferase [Nocardia bovistercoris]MBH0781399.1 GNAT family N-acetyltransferase [Nocardia bovistercoris]